MAGAVDVRRDMVKRLEQDLVGPLDPLEVMEAEKIRPSDVYLTGILWPIGDRMGAEDDDGASGDDEEDESASTPTIVGMQRPCTMGISLATALKEGGNAVEVEISFATYRHSVTKDENERKLHRWERVQWTFVERIDLATEAGPARRLEKDGLEAVVELNVRSLSSSVGLLSTVTLINRSRSEPSERDWVERMTLFQTQICIRPLDVTKIIARPANPTALDEDERSGRLLYRNCLEFAAGHQCSVAWGQDGNHATFVSTNWLPTTLVPAYREDGDDVFLPMLKSGLLEAEHISRASDADLLGGLNGITQAYSKWIDERVKEAGTLLGEHKNTAVLHIQRCSDVCARIAEGIQALAGDSTLLEAFKLANAAMALQHSWKRDSSGRKLPTLRWRPFQLGFILLAAHSTCVPTAKDRDVLDLLWFPTGGGKTEAYLALVAMLAWYRRLSRDLPDAGAGNAAVMRYTLRLLTAQQFERASAMILACELIRKGMVFPREGMTPVGKIPFSIGLWVGKDATPNDFKSAITNRGNRDGSSAEQVDSCPCCASKVRWSYNERSEQVRPFCENEACQIGSKFGDWPLFTVDQDIYGGSPTLLIGTVDKFAQIPFRKDIGTLFGFGSSRSTDLIIQDELHLISGPLGTITGLYETAFDWLLKKDGIKAKVIGSTATIRRAEEQVRALFDRQSCQFPPPGISYENSGFAVIDHSKPWRMYVGVSTAGRSAKFALQAVAGTLLQSGGPDAGFADSERDGYATLLCYFNSLRELGGAIVQMQDDVPDSVSLYGKRRNEKSRLINLPQELTSRVSQKEIIQILSELKRPPGDPDCVDVVLATNMVSVGVDVPRLGLMLVNGQPKTRSEYIQSTSRVGRSTFPGLVISVLNAAKARDRSHYETFPSWHSTIYRDVEATSVTPYASRARDRALRAVLVSMIRHGDPRMLNSPNLLNAPDKLLQDVVDEIERRVGSVDARELISVRKELNDLFEDWEAISPVQYLVNRFRPRETALLQYADNYARRVASGRIPGVAWPLMNTMRSVEPSSRFRIVEYLARFGRSTQTDGGVPATEFGSDQGQPSARQPRWRR